MSRVGTGLRPGSAQAARFLVVGVLSVVVDTVLLVALRETTPLPLWLATTGAYVAAVAVNFVLNLRWVWGAQGGLPGRIARYGVLVALNYALTLAIVLGLTDLGVFYVLAKWIAIGVGAVINFVAYRGWVFR